MKHFVYLLMIAGALSITACATTETSDESDQGSATEATSAEPAKAAESQTSTEAATEESTPAAAPAATEPQATTTTGSSSSADGSDITYVCTHDGNTRTIRVIYPDDGPNACEVTYEKSTGTQTLWNARNDSSYCEGKAVDFVAKQEGWGWQCNQQ